MNNCFVNIRIGLYHFQVTRSWQVRVSRNDVHAGYPFGRFRVYTFFGLERRS